MITKSRFLQASGALLVGTLSYASGVSTEVLEKPFCKEALEVRHFQVSAKNHEKLLRLAAATGGVGGGSFVVYKSLQNIHLATAEATAPIADQLAKTRAAKEAYARLQDTSHKDYINRGLVRQRQIRVDLYSTRLAHKELKQRISETEAALRKDVGKMTEKEFNARMRAIVVKEAEFTDRIARLETLLREELAHSKRLLEQANTSSMTYGRAAQAELQLNRQLAALQRDVPRVHAKHLLKTGMRIFNQYGMLALFLHPSELGDGTRSGAFRANPAMLFADSDMPDADFCHWVAQSGVQDFAHQQKINAARLEQALDRVQDLERVEEALKTEFSPLEKDPVGLQAIPRAADTIEGPTIGPAD